VRRARRGAARSGPGPSEGLRLTGFPRAPEPAEGARWTSDAARRRRVSGLVAPSFSEPVQPRPVVRPSPSRRMGHRGHARAGAPCCAWPDAARLPSALVVVDVELELGKTEDRREMGREQAGQGTEEESFMPEEKGPSRNKKCLCADQLAHICRKDREHARSDVWI
jgi:hypothetical protein